MFIWFIASLQLNVFVVHCAVVLLKKNEVYICPVQPFLHFHFLQQTAVSCHQSLVNIVTVIIITIIIGLLLSTFT